MILSIIYRNLNCSFSRDGFERTEQILSLPYNSDDDLTLEDLIAVETFDDSQVRKAWFFI